MKRTLVTCAALLAALPAAAQIQVQTQQVYPTPGGPQAPAQPAPCPGMGGLEIGQTRVFSFERMAKLEPEKQKVTRDLRVVHKPAGRPWVITVVYDSDAADAKVAGLYYLIEPPSGLHDALIERYGKGTPVPVDVAQTYWDIGACGVRLKYRARMDEKQRPVEELWVDPIPAKQAPAKAAPAKKKG
jgi:hypothetical protein